MHCIVFMSIFMTSSHYMISCLYGRGDDVFPMCRIKRSYIFASEEYERSHLLTNDLDIQAHALLARTF